MDNQFLLVTVTKGEKTYGSYNKLKMGIKNEIIVCINITHDDFKINIIKTMVTAVDFALYN